MSGWSAIYNNVTNALSTHAQAMASLQEQAASGLRIIRASDDPSDSNRVLNLRSEVRSMDSYISNLDSVSLSLEDVSTVVESLSGLLTRAQTLLTQAATGTLNQSNRQAIAGEIDGLLEQALFEANRQSLDKYIFSGQSIATAPYEATRTGDKITSVSYLGAPAELKVPVGPGVEYSGMVVGANVFGSNSRQEPVFSGDTGAAAGTGTSNVRGNIYLAVSNADTAFQGDAHGLAKGTVSTDATLVGIHALRIDSSDNSITLDGGEKVLFTPGDTNVEITAPDGSVVYIDTDAWDGTTADVTVVGTALLSIDGGATTTIVTDFTSDAAVTNASGQVLYVDTTSLDLAGTEAVRVDGTHNMFDTLINIRDLLSNEHGFSTQTQLDLLGDSVESLKEVSSQVRQNATAVGARLQAMDSLRTSLDNIRFNTKTEADSIQEADILEVATELARVQTFYEMTLSTSSKLLTMSLLDYL